MPRFVILTHDWPYPHFDFLLEEVSHLRGWRLATVPQPGKAIPATPLPNHRPLYLDYEGPLTGERGSVHRIEWGTFEWIGQMSESVLVVLRGERLNGPAQWLPDQSIWQF